MLAGNVLHGHETAIIGLHRTRGEHVGVHVGRHAPAPVRQGHHLQRARHRPRVVPVAVQSIIASTAPISTPSLMTLGSKMDSSGPVSNRSVCCDDGVRVVIRQDRPWAAQQRQRPLSHFIPRRHAPAISVSTNPGLVDKLSVPLSTRTVIRGSRPAGSSLMRLTSCGRRTDPAARPTAPSPLGPFYKRALGTPVEHLLVGAGDVYPTPKSATEVRAVRGAERTEASQSSSPSASTEAAPPSASKRGEASHRRRLACVRSTRRRPPWTFRSEITCASHERIRARRASCRWRRRRAALTFRRSACRAEPAARPG